MIVNLVKKIGFVDSIKNSFACNTVIPSENTVQLIINKYTVKYYIYDKKPVLTLLPCCQNFCFLTKFL